MSRPIVALGISGSLRVRSYNTALLKAACKLAPEGLKIELFDLRDIPFYDEDVRLAGFPPRVKDLRTALRCADAVLFASPEYNRSISGVIKNAIDWASRAPDQPFIGKPVAIIGASSGALGALMANHHLRQMLVYLDAVMVNGPEVLVGNAADKFDGAGMLVHEPTRAFIRDHLVKLVRLIHSSTERLEGRYGLT